MRTPFKTLTVGLVLATAAMAGCSSTTGGSAGAIQDEVTSPAPTSSSSSAGPTSSPDPVSPSPAPTEAPASPVASPTDSPSPSGLSDDPTLLGRTPPADVCDANMQYACGDIGQSGVGTVFYASSTAFPCGANSASSCNYLEVAPNLWNPDSQISCKAATGGTSCGGTVQTTSDFSSTGNGFPWCLGSKGGSYSINGADATGVGAGFANTTAMLPVCYPGDAGNVARSYTGGGLTDWSLPSKNELNALYTYSGRAGVGGFNSGGYWSSTQYKGNYAWYESFYQGNQDYYEKYRTLGVRPVRAF